ncbi:uncharacterized protein LOC120779575 [Bactrocera tryoni]|uniref:uncharacterized protein LOC120779575 n=1 Tax=Bactrocera tryoni TaxID=59916 RepID=UPI001A975DC9|nr:uncharacterized protein LOC120779575 [Bactrocera tryoni]
MASVNKDFVSEFIDLLKNEVAIWQTKSDKYKNKSEKNRSWNNLLTKYKEIDKSATLETVKKKYNGLRSCYRRELQKVRRSEKSGASAENIYIPTLWYFESLNFLMDQEIQMEGISSFEDCDDEEREPNHKRQKITEKDFLMKAVNFLDKSESNPKKDEASIYGEAWAVTYRKLNKEQQLFAKKLIDEALLHGQLGNLNITSFTKRFFTPAVPIQVISNEVISLSSSQSFQYLFDSPEFQDFSE